MTPMPGRLLHRIACRLCPLDADRIFEPLIADLQREWHDAPSGPRRGIALARAYASFWRTVASCTGDALVRGTLSPFDRTMAVRAALAFGGGVLGVVALRVIGALLGLTGLRMFGNSWGYWHRSLSAIAIGELQTLGWSVTFAMVPAFMYARPHVGRRWNATMVRLLTAGLVLAFVCVGWIGPTLFRASMPQAWDQAGNPHFQTLPTIIHGMRTARANDIGWRRDLERRLAQLATTALLALIGWALSGLRRPSPLRASLWWFALMELVLVSGAYAIDGAVSLQWRAPLGLTAILLALWLSRPALPARPARPAPSS
jgi:hypothetical protein